MRRGYLFIAAATLAIPLSVWCGSAQGGPTYGGTMKLDALQNSGHGGGEFVWNASGLNFTPQGLGGGAGLDGTIAANQFITFCVEFQEHVQIGQTSHVDINTKSINLGTHVLESKTAFLYTAFLQGTLADYDYDNSAGNRQRSAVGL